MKLPFWRRISDFDERGKAFYSRPLIGEYLWCDWMGTTWIPWCIKGPFWNFCWGTDLDWRKLASR